MTQFSICLYLIINVNSETKLLIMKILVNIYFLRFSSLLHLIKQHFEWIIHTFILFYIIIMLFRLLHSSVITTAKWLKLKNHNVKLNKHAMCTISCTHAMCTSVQYHMYFIRNKYPIIYSLFLHRQYIKLNQVY